MVWWLDCRHQLWSDLAEKRGNGQPGPSSQSDDLSLLRPAQLLSPSLAPPRRGRGPGCTGSTSKQTPPCLASLLPGTGPEPTQVNSQPLSPAQDTGGFVSCLPCGARLGPQTPSLLSLLTWLYHWLQLPGGKRRGGGEGNAGQTGSRLISRLIEKNLLGHIPSGHPSLHPTGGPSP